MFYLESVPYCFVDVGGLEAIGGTDLACGSGSAPLWLTRVLPLCSAQPIGVYLI